MEDIQISMTTFVFTNRRRCMQKTKNWTFVPGSILSNGDQNLLRLLVWHPPPQAALQKLLGFYVWLKCNLPPKPSTQALSKCLGICNHHAFAQKGIKTFPNSCTRSAEQYKTAAQTSPLVQVWMLLPVPASQPTTSITISNIKQVNPCPHLFMIPVLWNTS